MIGVDGLRAFKEDVFGLEVARIGDAAVDGADRGARLFVVEPDALGAQVGIDDVDVLALADGFVRALRLARAAVDALFRDRGAHRAT